MPIKGTKAKSTPKKTTSPKPRAKKSPAPKKSASAKTSTDKFTKSNPETKSEKPSRFQGFLSNLQGGFGQLHASTKPLDFSDQEKANGLKAAGTVERLAGKDGTWDKNDLANNFAQMQTSSGIRGRIERSVAQNKLFDTHKVPEADRAGIVNQSREIQKENPNIARLAKLEKMDPAKISDPDKRARYDELKSQWSSELQEKGLMPVTVPALQQMGDASDVLKEKLEQSGLPVPEGKPVDVDQYRGLFEGKAPIRTQLGL